MAAVDRSEPGVGLVPDAHWRPASRFAIPVAGAVAAVLILANVLLIPLSGQPRDQATLGLVPVFWLVLILMGAGTAYLALPWCVRRIAPTAILVAVVVAIGLVMRVILLWSAPLFEIDFYRYLWDGAAVVSGLNPYDVSPSAARTGEASAAWRDLAAQSGTVVAQINYPDLRTIYPPMAQGVFGLAHWLSPWSLTGLRLTLIAFDAATLGLLFLLLRATGRSPLWAALYWWNPLVVKEFANSAHMDAILLPFILGAILCAIRLRPVAASALLGLAAGVKLWPALLLPTVVRPVPIRGRTLIVAGLAFAMITGAMAAPVALAGISADSGFLAYARNWEFNGALFAALRQGLDWILDAAGVFDLDAGQIARALVAIGLLAGAFAINWRAPAGPTDLCRRALLLIAVLFLASPTGYPWYYAWMLPLLAVVPVWGLLALTVFLPLYYLRYHFGPRGEIETFSTLIVWLEFGPIFLILVWERTRHAVFGTPVQEQGPR